MTYLPYLLITPLVWLMFGFLLEEIDFPKRGAALSATFITLALWGLLLLVIN